MTRYAADTKVPVDRSRAEIERLFQRFGAEGFAYAWEGDCEWVAFKYAGKHVRLTLPMPALRGESVVAQRERDQERRRRWRSLTMVIKAVLVGVDDGIISFEEAFLAHFVTPDGLTLGQHIIPRLEAAAQQGRLPPLMLPGGNE